MGQITLLFLTAPIVKYNYLPFPDCKLPWLLKKEYNLIFLFFIQSVRIALTKKYWSYLGNKMSFIYIFFGVFCCCFFEGVGGRGEGGGGEDQWEAWNWSCDLRADARPKKNCTDGVEPHTDMATLWLNWPSGTDTVKMIYLQNILKRDWGEQVKRVYLAQKGHLTEKTTVNLLKKTSKKSTHLW